MRMRLGPTRELTTVQAADLTVVLVGAEGRIDEAQPVEDGVDQASPSTVVANVDDDRHAHDVLDPAETRRARDHQTFLAWSSAACSESPKP